MSIFDLLSNEANTLIGFGTWAKETIDITAQTDGGFASTVGQAYVMDRPDEDILDKGDSSYFDTFGKKKPSKDNFKSSLGQSKLGKERVVKKNKPKEALPSLNDITYLNSNDLLELSLEDPVESLLTGEDIKIKNNVGIIKKQKK